MAILTRGNTLKPVRRLMSLLAVALIVVASQTACGPKSSTGASGTKASAAVQQLQKDPNVVAAETKLQSQFQACSKTNSLWTKAGRKALVACIAPPGKEATVKVCLQQAVTKAVMITKAQRAALKAAAEKCAASAA